LRSAGKPRTPPPPIWWQDAQLLRYRRSPLPIDPALASMSRAATVTATGGGNAACAVGGRSCRQVATAAMSCGAIFEKLLSIASRIGPPAVAPLPAWPVRS